MANDTQAPEQEAPESQEPEQVESGIKATEKDIPHIVAHPERYGFKWQHEPISAKNGNDGKPLNNGNKVELRKDAPRIRLAEDGSSVELFIEWFGPKRLAKAFNGTSGDVESEGIVRTELLKKWHVDRARSVTLDYLKTELVKRVLLGQRAKGGGGVSTRFVASDGTTFKTAEEAAAHNAKLSPKTFRGLDGKDYPTGLEAKQASVLFYVEQHGMTPDIAAKLVANMPE